ncbi:hypothetical protein [Streptomyces griseus]|uniref:hypothetical protein n=1 Tax=Streptomyces griseus TaxID=1911 RepID=UPI0037AAB138
MTITTVPPRSQTGRSHLQESLFSWLTPQDRTPAPAPEQKAAPAPGVRKQPKDLSHTWVVAAEIPVAPKIAKVADDRGSFRATEGQRVNALEVYCQGCRRPYDEVAGTDCAEKIDNRHLIGGDQSTRAKRKIPTPPKNARILPGGTINRTGINAYVSGVSRPVR